MTPQQLSVASVSFKGVPEGRKPDIALYLLSLIQAAGGGGGVAPITQINVAGPPGGVPPAYSNFVVDSNGRVWTYWAGAWH